MIVQDMVIIKINLLVLNYFYKRGEFAPSVVFGGEDIWGTGLYTSKYLAFSKEIGYFDITLGYAKGRLGGQQVQAVSTTNSGSTTNTAFTFMKDFDWSGESHLVVLFSK